MTKASHSKVFIKYITLNVLGMVGISCYILADTFFVANGVGANGLAALNLAIPIYSFVHGCALMFGIGGATKYSIAKSQGEHSRANLIFTNTFAASVVCSLLFALVGIFFSQSLTSLLGADSELFEMTNIYLKVILLFSPFFMLNELLLAFVRNDSAPALAMTAMISGSVANIILDYIFIYPFQMGIFGAVLATGIAPIISMLILSVHKLKRRNQFHLIKFVLKSKYIAETVILGFPSLVTEVSAGIVMIVFNILILDLSGNIGVAAYGIIANIALVTTAIYTGIAQGVQPLVSDAYGKGNAKIIEIYKKYAFLTIAVVSLIIYAGISLFHREIAALFNSEQNLQLQKIAEHGLLIYFTSIPFVGFNIVISTFFTSTNHPMPENIVSLLRGLMIVLPIAYIFSILFGLTGIWMTVPVTELLTAFIGLCFHSKHKKLSA